MISYYLRLSLAFLVMSLLHRLIFVCGFGEAFKMSFANLTTLVLVGSRFDMMVMAYISIPSLLCALAALLLPRGAQLFWEMQRSYYLLVGFALAILTIVDLTWVQIGGDRFNRDFNWEQMKLLWEPNILNSLVIIAIFWTTGGFLRRVSLASIQSAKRSGWKSWIFSFLLFAFAARSSFGPHHLDLDFAEVTDSKIANRAIIPSAYAFDQMLRGRR